MREGACQPVTVGEESEKGAGRVGGGLVVCCAVLTRLAS